jgi:aspartate racemase
MGPLASAEFVASVYEQSEGVTEQDLPTLLLLSDPTIPDRTEALLNDRRADLAAEAAIRGNRLLEAGATKLIFCCITLHSVFDLLPPTIRSRVISLVDLIVDSVEVSSMKHLLLCTAGTRQARVFEQNERWNKSASRIVLLDDADQRALHSIIYRIKSGERVDRCGECIAVLARRYGVESCIAGCTELHMVAKRYQQSGPSALFWIDPLITLASRIGRRESSRNSPNTVR